MTRLFFVQVAAHDYYQKIADAQQLTTVEAGASRGEIYVRDESDGVRGGLYPIATNLKLYEVFINPDQITQPVNTARALSDTFGVPYGAMLERTKKEDDQYEPVVNKATEEQVASIRAAGMPGIYTREHVWRRYPDADVGSHVIGFYGIDGSRLVGKYGIEGYWEEELAGSLSEVTVARDGVGEIIPTADQLLTPETNGSDLVLTIDRTVQFEICSKLKETVGRFAADKGSVLVMETKTGALLGMCNIPAFDPNSYNTVEDIRVFNNDAVFEAYEPGSVLKPISMAIAVDRGTVTPSTVYEDTGTVTIAGRAIQNFDRKTHGTKSMVEVLQLSLNLGVVFATSNVDNRIFYEYMKNFGFGKKTGIELSQESAGEFRKLEVFKDVDKAVASYGHGFTATPLQIITAINTIANDGLLVKPYIVDEVRGPDGVVTKTQQQNIRRVIASSTAQTLAAMLVRVLEEGYDDEASVPGYYLAGKTGTAQIVENGKYTDKTNHTFVGFGPLENPKFTILIKLHNVKNVGFAADSTTKLFHDLAEFLINYYKIPPRR